MHHYNVYEFRKPTFIQFISGPFPQLFFLKSSIYKVNKFTRDNMNYIHVAILWLQTHRGNRQIEQTIRSVSVDNLAIHSTCSFAHFAITVVMYYPINTRKTNGIEIANRSEILLVFVWGSILENHKKVMDFHKSYHISYYVKRRFVELIL